MKSKTVMNVQNMTISATRLFVGFALSISSVYAFAAPVAIDSYDATGLSGHGVYDGKKSTSSYTKDWSYTGGSGSLNDGKVTNNNYDSHLFFYKDSGSITLHLSEFASISSLRLFSPETTDNFYLGSIAGLNVTINGETRYIATQGFGPGSAFAERDHIHEYVSLIGTGLESLYTDTITLSGFVADEVLFRGSSPSAGFYLAEITVDGNPYAVGTVSEPVGLALLGTGMLGLGLLRRRKLPQRFWMQ